MSLSPGSPKQLPRGRSTHGPTKTAWTTRCDHLQPRGDLTGRTRSRRQEPKHKTVDTTRTENIGKIPIRSTRAERSFMWRDFKIPEDRQEPKTGAIPDIMTESDDEDIIRDTAQHQDRDDDQRVTVEEKDSPFEEESKSQEIEHSASVDSGEKKVPLKRQLSSDSLFGGKQVKPGTVWTPYGPPLYGYGSSLNPPPGKRPDTLLILAAIFYCLAVLTAVVFAVLFKTKVMPAYMTPAEPVPAWMQQFSPEMQRWYQLALQAAGGDTSAILPPGYVQQPTVEPSVHEACGNMSLPDLRHGDFICTSIAHQNIYVRMCIAKCDVGYQTDDAGLLFCNRGRWAPIAPEVVSTLVGVGRAADTMPNTDLRVFKYLGISDQIYADAARGILFKLNVPNLPIVETYLDMISVDNIIDFDMMRQLLEWIGPSLDGIVENLDFLQVLSRLETFGATRHPECKLVDCRREYENVAHGKMNRSPRTSTNMSEARVACERGYLPRHPVLTCNATGHWDKPAQCDPVTCSPPEDPPHGSYLCQGYVFSDPCDVICDVGYLPETDDALGCSWTGNWTAFRRGNTTEMESAVSAGNTRTFAVYQDSATDVILPQTLACIIADCGNISMPTHGDVTCTGTTYGETCHLACQDGYELLGQDSFTCQVYRLTDKATWSGEPKCIPVSCGSPPEFPNTALQCASGHTYGNTCGVTCADGYEGTNHRSVACHSSGNWSLQEGILQPVVGGPDLFCQKKDCGNLTSPANGSLTCSGTRYQDSCRLACEPGYKVGNEQDLHLHSLHSFTCMATGQWNDKPRCVSSDYCRLGLHDCHPEHGICDLTGHQTFSCRCRPGTVGDGRRCERTSCPPFPVAEPENGYFGCSIPASPAADFCQSPDSTTAEYEVVCLLHCNPGYDRLIYAEYSCGHDGNWTVPFDPAIPGSTPCLALKCPDLSSPLHGRMACNMGFEFRYPEACNFTCDRGYQLTTPTSSIERRCQTDATWSGNDAVCIGVQCPTLSSPVNGRISCDNSSSFRFPENCSFSCDPGYELHERGNNSRTCQADAPDNRGTEFMVGFLQNAYARSPNPELELFITSASSTPTSVTVSAPGASFTRRLTVTDAVVQVVSLPQSLALSGNEKAQKGVSITSDTEIIVYGVNKVRHSTDGFLGLPIDVIGKEYFVASYTRSVEPSEFGIFATEDNTDVEITLRGNTVYGGVAYSTGSVIRSVLNKFEAVQFQGSDLTGTQVTSNKPVTLMSGVQCVNVPAGVSAPDHIVEQIPPVNTWGRRFVTVPLAVRTGGDIFRIVAARDGTIVTVTGHAVKLLHSGDFWELDVPSNVYQVITSSEPIMVLQYNKGLTADGVNTDPFMMYVPPIEHFAADYTFTTVDAAGSVFNNYINVVIKTTETSGLLYDGSPLPSSTSWVQIPDTDLSAAQLHINATGTHKLKHTSAIVTFSVFYYGYSSYDSVGFPGGMRFEHISRSATACPNGYIYHHPSRSCYKTFNQESNYTHAVTTCTSDGGTLAMPRDAVTNTFLINLKNAVDNSASFRFGLTDIHQEGRWVWEDGRVLGGFSSWASGEPNNGNGFFEEDCAEYFSKNYVHVTDRNKWNDGSCSDHRPRKFICQAAPT
ncbi:Carboxypeptidase N [Branchiostoma belcheri]|nr:Carboxypeptidase N [Branchiostoma belcheri]